MMRPVRDAIAPPGHMNADGSINPCHGYRVNPQACGDALYNGARIKRIAIGQTLANVREIMGRDAGLRSVGTHEGHESETWDYLTDYDQDITTRIEFVDGKVVAIRQQPH